MYISDISVNFMSFMMCQTDVEVYRSVFMVEISHYKFDSRLTVLPRTPSLKVVSFIDLVSVVY